MAKQVTSETVRDSFNKAIVSSIDSKDSTDLKKIKSLLAKLENTNYLTTEELRSYNEKVDKYIAYIDSLTKTKEQTVEKPVTLVYPAPGPIVVPSNANQRTNNGATTDVNIISAPTPVATTNGTETGVNVISTPTPVTTNVEDNSAVEEEELEEEQEQEQTKKPSKFKKFLKAAALVGAGVILAGTMRGCTNGLFKSKDTDEIENNSIVVTAEDLQSEFITNNQEEVDRVNSFISNIKENGYDMSGEEATTLMVYPLNDADATDLYSDKITTAYSDANETMLNASTQAALYGNVLSFSELFEGEDKEFLAELEDITRDYVEAYQKNDTSDMTLYQKEYNNLIFEKFQYSIGLDQSEIATVVALQSFVYNNHFDLEINDQVLAYYVNENGDACNSINQLYTTATGLQTRNNQSQMEINVISSVNDGYTGDVTIELEDGTIEIMSVSEDIRRQLTDQYNEYLLGIELGEYDYFKRDGENDLLNDPTADIEDVEESLNEEAYANNDVYTGNTVTNSTTGELEAEGNVSVGDVVSSTTTGTGSTLEELEEQYGGDLPEIWNGQVDVAPDLEGETSFETTTPTVTDTTITSSSSTTTTENTTNNSTTTENTTSSSTTTENTTSSSTTSGPTDVAPNTTGTTVFEPLEETEVISEIVGEEPVAEIVENNDYSTSYAAEEIDYDQEYSTGGRQM
ncbi:MAG: hypothetical protein R3Y21_02655 [Mycoplasmatota bacterium]